MGNLWSLSFKYLDSILQQTNNWDSKGHNIYLEPIKKKDFLVFWLCMETNVTHFWLNPQLGQYRLTKRVWSSLKMNEGRWKKTSMSQCKHPSIIRFMNKMLAKVKNKYLKSWSSSLEYIPYRMLKIEFFKQ